MDNWRNWIQQPTTVAGLSTALGTVVGLALQQMDLPQAIPLLVGAAVSMILPDNTGAGQQAQVLATQIVDSIAHKAHASSLTMTVGEKLIAKGSGHDAG